MSVVKVQNKALNKMMSPVHHCVQPDIAFSLSHGGIAARLYHHSIYGDIARFDIGRRVTVSRLSKRCLFLYSASPLDLNASYALSLQGFDVMTGFLTPLSDSNSSRFSYSFHTNTWLTDEEVIRLVVDIE